MRNTRRLKILLTLLGILLCSIPASSCRKRGSDEAGAEARNSLPDDARSEAQHIPPPGQDGTGAEVRSAFPENMRCEAQYIPDLDQIEFSIFDGGRHVQTLHVPDASGDEDGGESLLAENLKDFEEFNPDLLRQPRIDVEKLEDYIGGIDEKCAQKDVTGDGRPELLVHLGNFGVSENIYQKAYRWDEKQRSFVAIEGYSLIPNPDSRDGAVYGYIRRGGANYLYSRYVFKDGRFVPDSEVEMLIPDSELEKAADDTAEPKWRYIERIYTGGQAKAVRESTSVSDLSDRWRKTPGLMTN